MLAIHDLIGHFGVIRCNYREIACKTKIAVWKSKQTEIWDSEVLVVHIHVCGIFDLVVLSW